MPIPVLQGADLVETTGCFADWAWLRNAPLPSGSCRGGRPYACLPGCWHRRCRPCRPRLCGQRRRRYSGRAFVALEGQRA